MAAHGHSACPNSPLDRDLSYGYSTHSSSAFDGCALSSGLSRELPHIHPAWHASASPRYPADRQGPKRTDSRFARPVPYPFNTGLVTNAPELPARSPAQQNTLLRNAVPFIGFGTVTAPNKALQRTLRVTRFARPLVPLNAKSFGGRPLASLGSPPAERGAVKPNHSSGGSAAELRLKPTSLASARDSASLRPTALRWTVSRLSAPLGGAA
jgi:hypothetical protein